MPPVAGPHQRCATILLGGVHGGAAAQQRLRRVHCATLRRVYQCRRAIVWVAGLNIGSGFNKHLDGLLVARLAGRGLERCEPYTILEVNSRTSV